MNFMLCILLFYQYFIVFILVLLVRCSLNTVLLHMQVAECKCIQVSIVASDIKSVIKD